MEAEDLTLIIITFLVIVIFNFIVFVILLLKKETSFGEMEILDQNAMEEEEFEDLHLAIGKGDTVRVKQIVESHKQEKYFSSRKTSSSALCKAYKCRNYVVISFLLHKGAKIHEYEVDDLKRLDIELPWINYLLLHYNKKPEKSCIYKFMSVSQSPQELKGERLNAVESMYDFFFRFDIIRSLMSVLEGEAFDIVYDFESDKVNTIHHCAIECDIKGLTLLHSKEIFIGSEHLLSDDPHKRQKVYGVVAEELCHLAMTIVFENDAKPFTKEDSKLAQEFQQIVLDVKSLIGSSSSIESVIRDVFDNYRTDNWECELIARVPHVVGIYGEEFEGKVFKGCKELSSLLSFYLNNVHEKCKLYTDPSVNTKSHREMERLTKKIEFISFKEREARPLKEGFESFRKYLVVIEGISVITTNCAKLCTLHIYHELKQEHGLLLEKKCLFFSRKCFEKNRCKIWDAMKLTENNWEYLILVMDKREINWSTFQNDYLRHFEEFIKKGMKLIMISSTQSTDQMFDFQKALNYRWSNLSEEYKTNLQVIKYLFKGVEEETFVRKEDFPKLFDQDDISVIINGEMIEVNDGNELFSQGYVPETYIQREFHYTVADDKIFTNVPRHTNIFLSGFDPSEHKRLPFQEEQVQWLKGSHDTIQSDKSIFIVNKDAEMSFEDFRKRCPNEKCVWLHYNEEELHVRNIDSCGDVFGNHIKQKTISEEEMLNFLKRERTVIISDNAGYGKSTVISSLIDKTKNYRSWNWRINFSKFVGNKKDPLCIAHIEEQSRDQIMNHLFLILGMENGFVKFLFKDFSEKGQCFIYFDGFDEIPSEYKDSALKLLSTVRKMTAVNMIISTRKHHQKELEELLNTYSHQLVPLSREYQVKYLDKMWKDKLKYPNGRMASQNDSKRVPERIRNILKEFKDKRSNLGKELNDFITALDKIDLGDLDEIRRKIDDLDFRKLAETVIEKTSLDKETLQFMGIPLHLFMVGEIYLDNNFNAEMKSDVHSIYSDFIEKKIYIYVEEKGGICLDGWLKNFLIEKLRVEANRIHTQLANQLMDKGKIGTIMEEKDLELCRALGIVYIDREQINFLHHTFAEFFKAESIRMNLNEKGFKDVLSDEKYKVVVRFLAVSLEKNKKFENLTKEFFKDEQFLVSVLKQFVDLCESMNYWDRNYELELHLHFIATILKSLIETFENCVHEDLLNAFVSKLDIELSSLKYWFMIGGCLSMKTFKMLINRNFDVYYKLTCGVVKFYTNPDEVKKVLEECFLIEGETNEGENEKMKRLLKVLKFRDGNSLFDWALRNVRIEVYLEILKFSKEKLGKEQFINEIIKSEEYLEAMYGFINEVDFNGICDLLKGLDSVMNNEMETMINNNLKFRILRRTIIIRDESRNAFEEMINLFKEYFGIENIKESLLSCDHVGTFLIHYLISYENRNLIDNLNIIKSILDDESKMKQFLMFKDGELRNMFHLAARNRDINSGKILGFVCENLEKHEFVEMLISCDIDGDNVLDSLFQRNSSEEIIEGLNDIKNALDDQDLFQNLLKSKNRQLKDMCHLAAQNRDNNFGKILGFVCENIEKHEIVEMLISCDELFGANVLHLLVGRNLSEEIIERLNDIKNALDDKDLFKNLLKSKNRQLRNIFHLAAQNRYINFGEILGFVCENIEKHEIVEMLISCDEYFGANVLHLLFRNNSSEEITEGLNVIKNALDDKELLKTLLKSKNRKLMNMFHLAAQNRDINFVQILGFGCENLGKHEIVEMLDSCDKDGDNVLDLLFQKKSSKEIIEGLNDIKNALDDKKLFQNLLKSKNRQLKDMCHLAAQNRDNNSGKILGFVCENLEKHEIREMLISCDKDGDNVLHSLFESNSSEDINEGLNVIKNALADKESFKDLLKSKSRRLKNIFHFAASNRNEIDISFLNSHLSDIEISELLIERDENGWTFLQSGSIFHSTNFLLLLEYSLENLKVDKSMFEDLILAEDKSGDTFLHLLIQRYSHNKEQVVNKIIEFLKENVSEKIFNKLLRIRNVKGKSFLQVQHWYGKEYSEKVIEIFKRILEKSLFEELLTENENNGEEVDDLEDSDEYDENIDDFCN